MCLPRQSGVAIGLKDYSLSFLFIILFIVYCSPRSPSEAGFAVEAGLLSNQKPLLAEGLFTALPLVVESDST